MQVDEIRESANGIDFVFVRNGQVEPLIYQELQSVLRANFDRFYLQNKITPQQHEAVYQCCLKIEQVARQFHESKEISMNYQIFSNAEGEEPEVVTTATGGELTFTNMEDAQEAVDDNPFPELGLGVAQPVQ